MCRSWASVAAVRATFDISPVGHRLGTPSEPRGFLRWYRARLLTKYAFCQKWVSPNAVRITESIPGARRRGIGPLRTVDADTGGPDARHGQGTGESTGLRRPPPVLPCPRSLPAARRRKSSRRRSTEVARQIGMGAAPHDGSTWPLARGTPSCRDPCPVRLSRSDGRRRRGARRLAPRSGGDGAARSPTTWWRDSRPAAVSWPSNRRRRIASSGSCARRSVPTRNGSMPAFETV